MAVFYGKHSIQLIADKILTTFLQINLSSHHLQRSQNTEYLTKVQGRDRR